MTIIITYLKNVSMKIIIFGLQGMQMINIMKESNIPFASLYDYNESSTLDGAKIIIGS